MFLSNRITLHKSLSIPNQSLPVFESYLRVDGDKSRSTHSRNRSTTTGSITTYRTAPNRNTLTLTWHDDTIVRLHDLMSSWNWK